MSGGAALRLLPAQEAEAPITCAIINRKIA
jgi:hypothetical protein